MSNTPPTCSDTHLSILLSAEDGMRYSQRKENSILLLSCKTSETYLCRLNIDIVSIDNREYSCGDCFYGLFVQGVSCSRSKVLLLLLLPEQEIFKLSIFFIILTIDLGNLSVKDGDFSTSSDLLLQN